MAGRAKLELARAGFSQNVDRRALQFRALHLAGDRARPDEFVELRLLGLEMTGDVARSLRHVGRADRLVRLLRVLGLGGIFARRRRHVVVAEVLGDDAPSRRDRLGRKIDAVGTHIGNEAGRAVADIDAFVEALRELHGARRREAELRDASVKVGGEWRIRVALDRLRFDRGDREERLLKRGLERSASAPEPMSRRMIFLPSAPTRRAVKGALASVRKWATIDQYSRATNFSISSSRRRDPKGDRLHATGRARAGELPPQDRGQGEADQIVERAARPIGVDKGLVDLARIAHRLLDRVLGHRVEHDAVDALVLEQLLALKNLMDVPGDGLAFAVRVGREDHAVGVLHCSANVAQPLGGLGVDLPAHREIVVRVDRAVFGREIPHMAERGVDLVVLAQIFVDGLRLGRRLDDHDFHSGNFLQRPATRSRCLGRSARGIWRRRGRLSNDGRMGSGGGSGRALDIRLREIVALVEKRSAAEPWPEHR